MKFNFRAATIGALFAIPVCAFAQQSSQLPDPADPGVAVAAPTYDSAFASAPLPRPQEGAPTPDKLWKAANATVAALDAASGHAGHGGHGGHAGHTAPAPAAQPAAKPATQPAVDHSKHH